MRAGFVLAGNLSQPCDSSWMLDKIRCLRNCDALLVIAINY